MIGINLHEFAYLCTALHKFVYPKNATQVVINCINLLSNLLVMMVAINLIFAAFSYFIADAMHIAGRKFNAKAMQEFSMINVAISVNVVPSINVGKNLSKRRQEHLGLKQIFKKSIKTFFRLDSYTFMQVDNT